MATRSAPTVDGTPGYYRISMHWIDASGDKRSISVQTESAEAEDVEAFVAQAQLLSNASLYEVEVTQVYAGTPAKANATAGVYPSVYDNVVVLYKTPNNFSQNAFIPAPDASIMGTDSDVPIVANLTAFNTTFLALANGGLVTYTPISARFTERREKNQRVMI